MKRFLSVLSLIALLAAVGSVQAQGPGKQGVRGGPPSFDKLLDAFDYNDDGALSMDEVPARMWMRLSMADANGDAIVTQEEFNAVRKRRPGK